MSGTRLAKRPCPTERFREQKLPYQNPYHLDLREQIDANYLTLLP